MSGGAPFKLVLADYDGTLATPGAMHVTRHCLSAIHELMETGVTFGPITGRTPARIADMFWGDAACYANGAFVNGQVIYIDGQMVRAVELPREPLDRARELLDATPDAALTCGLLDEEISVFITSDSAKAETHMKESPWYGGVRRELPSGPLVKSGIHVAGSMERVAELLGLLRERVPELEFVRPSMSLPYIDILPHGWDKGRAVEAFCEALGIGIDEAVVFGDSENDLAMLKAVPNSVAMANSMPEAAACARWHIGSCYDDAVADALLDLAAATRQGTVPQFMRR